MTPTALKEFEQKCRSYKPHHLKLYIQQLQTKLNIAKTVFASSNVDTHAYTCNMCGKSISTESLAEHLNDHLSGEKK